MSNSVAQRTSVREEAFALLSRLGALDGTFVRDGLAARSPITGEVIGHVRITSKEEASAVIDRAARAFAGWRWRGVARGKKRSGQAGDAGDGQDRVGGT